MVLLPFHLHVFSIRSWLEYEKMSQFTIFGRGQLRWTSGDVRGWLKHLTLLGYAHELGRGIIAFSDISKS